MKRAFILILALLYAVLLTAQDVTLKFSTTSSDGSYFPFDVVNVTNVTRGWTESLVYPDTTMVLTSCVGVQETFEEGFLSEVYPNPFSGEAETMFNMKEKGLINVKLFSVNGELLSEYNGYIEEGTHQIRLSVNKPQMVVFAVKTNKNQYVKKVLNIGYGNENSITVNRISNERISEKTRNGEFTIGDIMSYVAIAINNGDMIESDRVTKAQYTSETIILAYQMTKPMVSTTNISDITSNSAMSGGVVISNGNGIVSNRGICWSTVPNPTINNSHTNDGSGLGAFTSNLEGLAENTLYYVRAYATNEAGTSYGGEISFTTELLTGGLPGLFSISENQQVRFSKGNLQYIGSANLPYWKFADNQWDFLGNAQNGTSAFVDRDLFGWGTSNYNHGAICYQPWSVNTSSYNYYAYGDSYYDLNENTGKADWGYNAISNGGNMENLWRTLTYYEWLYLFNERNTVSGIRWVKAQVNGVCGVILLPDNWIPTIYTLYNPNGGFFYNNVISSENWTNIFEVNGAVFLPSAGHRYYYSYVPGDDHFGSYWTSTHYNNTHAYSIYFNIDNVNVDDNSGRFYGFSVRLVHDVDNEMK